MRFHLLVWVPAQKVQIVLGTAQILQAQLGLVLRDGITSANMEQS